MEVRVLLGFRGRGWPISRCLRTRIPIEDGHTPMSSQPIASNLTLRELLGAACDTFLNTDEVSLSAEFPCGGVVVD